MDVAVSVGAAVYQLGAIGRDVNGVDTEGDLDENSTVSPSRQMT